MYDLQTEVLSLLAGAADSSARALAPLFERNSKEPDFYSRLFQVLAHVRLGEQKARYHVESMLAHHDYLLKTLARDVDFRVTVLDYLVAHPELVRSPGVVDLDVFEETQRRATTDQLTGLYNRRFLQSYLDKEVNRANRYDQEFSVLFLDVDDFKSINDTHGHTVGDQVLGRMAQSIIDLLRREDIAARYGGEEFVIVLPQTKPAGAEAFARRLRRVLRNDHSKDHVSVRFSAGIASFPINGTSPDELITNADTALYQAKLAGKDRVFVSGVEKRRGHRYRTDMPVVCFAEETELGTAKVFDISTEGIALFARRAIKPGQLLKLRVNTGESTATYDVVTTVVWSREVSDEHAFKLGARWANTDEETIEALIRTAMVS